MLTKIDITKLKYYTTGYKLFAYYIGMIDNNYAVQISNDEISLIEIGNDPLTKSKTTTNQEREKYSFSEIIRYNLLPGIFSSDTKSRIMDSLEVIGNMDDYRNFLISRERDRKLSQLV